MKEGQVVLLSQRVRLGVSALQMPSRWGVIKIHDENSEWVA